MFDEWQRQLLGQYRDGEFLPHLKDGVDLSEYLSNQKPSSKGYFRIHRNIL